MCLIASVQTMGCGKSRHHSQGDSETDVKNSGSYTYTKNSSKQNSGKNAKKKVPAGEDKKQTDKTGDKETAERSPSFRKISNGKTRAKDRDEEIGFQASSSLGNPFGASSASAADSADRSNGASKTQSKNNLLEVPNEISKTTTQTRTACKDFKTITTSKGVHVTTSQLEFFKMLDDKIEKGGDYQASSEASEVSSLDETYKQ